MRYAAEVEKDGKSRVVTFPDCPGCVTQADAGEDVEQMAQEALEGWLESNLANGRVPPLPKNHRNVLWVEVSPLLGLKVSLRAARDAKGWTQKRLAEEIGVSQPMVAKLEDPDQNVTVETVAKAATALGLIFDPTFRKAG